MKTLWLWLEKNSAQLQGLAAVAGILGALAVVPYFTAKWLEPELLVTVTNDEATTPPILEEWLRGVTSELSGLPAPEKGESDPYASLRKLQVTGPLEPARFAALRSESMDRVRVDVTNQTDRVMPGVRLRFDHARPIWGIDLVATFLTADEIARWKKSLPSNRTDLTLVLPELPPLPPNSSASLFAYGDARFADVSVAVPGSSLKLVKAVTLKDSGLIYLILRPYWLPLLSIPVLIAIVLALTTFQRIMWRRACRFIPYKLACREAKAGRQESALSLLKVAVSEGYDDFHHMSTDQDLISLRELDAFKRLCKPRDPTKRGAEEKGRAPNTGPQADG